MSLPVYRILSGPPSEVEPQMNELADEYEFVGFEPTQHYRDLFAKVIVVMRRKDAA